MVLRIAGLPVWVAPTEVIAGARAVLGWTDDAVSVVATLPERLSALLDEVDVLVGRITEVATRVEAAVDRVENVLVSVRSVADGAAGLVERADEVATEAGVLVAGASTVAGSAAVVVETAQTVAGRAGTVIDEAAAASRSASELLTVYQPIAERAAPLAARFVQELTEAEVQAAIQLIDQLPQLTEHLETDIMPILATLDRVGPDVHELLDVLKDVRQAVSGIPGFNLLRRRGEREDNER